MESIERRVVRIVMGLYIESHEELGMVSSVKIIGDAVESDLQPCEGQSHEEEEGMFYGPQRVETGLLDGDGWGTQSCIPQTQTGQLFCSKHCAMC